MSIEPFSNSLIHPLPMVDRYKTIEQGGAAEIRTWSHRNTKQLHVSKYLSGPMHYGEDSRSVICLRFVRFGFCTFISIRTAQV